MFWLKMSKYKSNLYLLEVCSRYNFTPPEQNVNFSKRPVKSKDYFFQYFMFHTTKKMVIWSCEVTKYMSLQILNDSQFNLWSMWL